MTKMHENEFHLDESLVHQLIALPYYKHTSPVLANNAQHVIQELVHDYQNHTQFHFA